MKSLLEQMNKKHISKDMHGNLLCLGDWVDDGDNVDNIWRIEYRDGKLAGIFPGGEYWYLNRMWFKHIEKINHL